MVSAQHVEITEQADEMPRTISLAHPVLFGKAGRIVYGTGNWDHDKGNRAGFRSPYKATQHWRGRYRRQSATRRWMCPDPANCAPGAQFMSLLVGAERRSRDPAGFLLLKLPDSPPGVTASETKQSRDEIAAYRGQPAMTLQCHDQERTSWIFSRNSGMPSTR